MSQSSASAQPPWRPAEIEHLSSQVETMLRAFGLARRARRMTSDDALIFLASGRLGLSLSEAGLAIRPVTCQEVSTLLKIPRETVRRKATRLAEIDLVTVTSSGMLVKNVVEWLRLAESFKS